MTPIPIFDDVRDIVHTLPGNEPIDIANGIISIFQSDSIQSLTTTSREWINVHKFSNLAHRLFGLIRSLENNY